MKGKSSGSVEGTDSKSGMDSEELGINVELRHEQNFDIDKGFAYDAVIENYGYNQAQKTF